MTTLTINGIRFDAAAPKSALAALSPSEDTAQDSDYLLVQPTAPLDAGQRARLAAAGAKILEAVPGGGLVCQFPGTDLGQLRALPFVQRVTVYPKIVKLSPALLELAHRLGGVDAAVAALAPAPELDARPVTVDVLLHRDIAAGHALQQVADAAHLDSSMLVAADGKIRLRLKRRRLADVAALDVVRSIEAVQSHKLANNVARSILRVPASSQAPSPAQAGDGEVIAIADTGLDRGSIADMHPAFTGRVKSLYPIGRAGLVDDPNGHGTHVAGSAMGNGVSAADGLIQGAAPGAELVLQSLLDSEGKLRLPAHLGQLFQQPYQADGARIHSNSWGSIGSFGVYDAQAAEVDAFVHTCRDMLVCFAAGNDGRDDDSNGQVEMGSVTPPGTAKNCLTVGASENNRPAMSGTYGTAWSAAFPVPPMRDDLLASNAEGMAAFSSRGPTNDRRIKPDVVAPGTFILSARSRATKSTGWAMSGDALYMYEGGTSMATPLVAGGAAVIREFLRVSHGATMPSAALLKALIINGAHALAGQYTPSEAGAVPNNVQGFGRVDIQAVVGPYAPGETLQFFDEAAALDTRESHDRLVTVPSGARQLKVTLVWTDPPGEGLQSDLDLIVRSGSVERHGNMPAGSPDFDRINNVEQVTWQDVPAGPVTIVVAAHSVAIAPQNYALVIRIR